MAGRDLSLAPAAIGLALANALSIIVVIGSCFTAARAAELRDRAVTALAEAQATGASRGTNVQPVGATIHATAASLPGETMDRMLFLGVVGVAGSAFCTSLVIRRITQPESMPSTRLKKR